MEQLEVGELHRTVPAVPEEVAVSVCLFLDSQNPSNRTLFFEETCHNWDPETGDLSIVVTFTSEEVALRSINDAIRTAEEIHQLTS